MLNFAAHYFSSLPMLREDVSAYPVISSSLVHPNANGATSPPPQVPQRSDQPLSSLNSNNRRKRLTNQSRTWSTPTSVHVGGSYEEKIKHKRVKKRSKDALMLKDSSYRPKFNPQRHGFPSPATHVTLRVLDASQGISFGSVSLRCTSTLSDIRNLMEDGDSSAFVFVHPEGGERRVKVKDEKHVMVGLYAPQITAVLEPPQQQLPPLGGSSNQESPPGSAEKKKMKKRSLGSFSEKEVRWSNTSPPPPPSNFDQQQLT
jgi:hypothetical protein